MNDDAGQRGVCQCTSLGVALNHAVHRAIFANPRYQRVLIGISALDNPSVKYGEGARTQRFYTLYRSPT